MSTQHTITLSVPIVVRASGTEVPYLAIQSAKQAVTEALAIARITKSTQFPIMPLEIITTKPTEGKPS